MGNGAVLQRRSQLFRNLCQCIRPIERWQVACPTKNVTMHTKDTIDINRLVIVNHQNRRKLAIGVDGTNCDTVETRITLRHADLKHVGKLSKIRVLWVFDGRSKVAKDAPDGCRWCWSFADGRRLELDSGSTSHHQISLRHDAFGLPANLGLRRFHILAVHMGNGSHREWSGNVIRQGLSEVAIGLGTSNSVDGLWGGTSGIGTLGVRSRDFHFGRGNINLGCGNVKHRESPVAPVGMSTVQNRRLALRRITFKVLLERHLDSFCDQTTIVSLCCIDGPGSSDELQLAKEHGPLR